MDPDPSSRNLFLDLLPVELLQMIKKNISAYDLRTHVCFYHTCCHVSSVYGTGAEEEAFWEQTCWLAGIGLKIGEDCDAQSPMWDTWKSIAFYCIRADGFCRFEQCGGHLLESNGACQDHE